MVDLWPEGIQWEPGDRLIIVGHQRLPVVYEEHGPGHAWVEVGFENGARLAFDGWGYAGSVEFGVMLACHHRIDTTGRGDDMPQPAALFGGRLVHSDSLSAYHDTPEIAWLEEFLERAAHAGSCTT